MASSSFLTHTAAARTDNPPFDLGPARTLFRKMAEYAAILGVDADRRDGWGARVEQIAAFPTTTDPTSGKTVLNQQEYEAGFPTVKSPGNGKIVILSRSSCCSSR